MIGVATSVGWNGRTYDTLDTLAYAEVHGFPLVQVYLTPGLIESAEERAEVRRRAAAAGIRLMAHAPGRLNDGPGCSPAVPAAAVDLLANEQTKWLIHHFDEDQWQTAATELARPLGKGLIPCLENFHTNPGAEAARTHYQHYLQVFRILRGKRIPAVIDIPRFFAADLGLGHEEAGDLVIQVLRELAELNVPVIFHLIDSTTRNFADRARWCALGEGVIGYRELWPRVMGLNLRVEATVLEFDDQVNPLASRELLERCAKR